MPVNAPNAPIGPDPRESASYDPMLTPGDGFCACGMEDRECEHGDPWCLENVRDEAMGILAVVPGGRA